MASKWNKSHLNTKKSCMTNEKEVLNCVKLCSVWFRTTRTQVLLMVDQTTFN